MSGRKKVLLIDDDEFVSEMTRQALQKIGYDAMTVTSAKVALTAFSENPRQFDLIMVDHFLSDGNGVELAGGLLRIRPDIPIVLYTGGQATIEDVRSKGICAVISKGLSRRELGETLRFVFDAA
jgi:DNA-binding NtrC family response regulator